MRNAQRSIGQARGRVENRLALRKPLADQTGVVMCGIVVSTRVTIVMRVVSLTRVPMRAGMRVVVRVILPVTMRAVVLALSGWGFGSRCPGERQVPMRRMVVRETRHGVQTPVTEQRDQQINKQDGSAEHPLHVAYSPEQPPLCSRHGPVCQPSAGPAGPPHN